MKRRCVSFNVLADAYTGYGHYDYVTPALLEPGARLPLLVQFVNGLEADIVGLQEATPDLLHAFKKSWQVVWTQKTRGKPDGCLLLVKPGLKITYITHWRYRDSTGHIAQLATIEGTRFANTHIKWSEPGAGHHSGVVQAQELSRRIGAKRPAVIFADCNDRPGGPVRELLQQAGFVNAISDETPTAFVNGEAAALDLVAVRGREFRYVDTGLEAAGIPNQHCPSDHLPVVADIELA